MLKKNYDVAIIGAGVIGCAIARELSRFQLGVCVFEKEADVCFGTSCRNSGVLHSGINYQPGTNRALLNVRGNAMMDVLCKDLKVPLKRIGKLTIALSQEDLPGLYKQYEQGKANGVQGMELMKNSLMQKIQPGINGVLGLWTPSSAIISPYGLTIALAENAIANGVAFYLNSEVTKIKSSDHGGFELSVEGGRNFSASVIINAAGLHADKVSEFAGVKVPQIWACRGEYYVLDKRLDGLLKTLVYPVPGPNDPGLGIHLTPTVDGNILIGPSAAYISSEDRESYRTTREIMQSLREEGARMLPDLSTSDFIRNFSGNRPKLTPPEIGGNAEFHIENVAAMTGFIQLVGIESPGLTSSPAIAEVVRDMVRSHLHLQPKDTFIAGRPGFVGHFSQLPSDKRLEMIAAEPEYGEIICRCEKITKKEVRDAIENPLRAHALLSLKYRVRTMMGRCQGGFCMPRIVRMLRDEYGYEPHDFMLRSVRSPLFFGHVMEASNGLHRK